MFFEKRILETSVHRRSELVGRRVYDFCMREAPNLDRRQFLERTVQTVAGAGAVATVGVEGLTPKSAEAAEARKNYESFDRKFEGSLDQFIAEVSPRIEASERLENSFVQLGRMFGDSIRLEKPMTDPKVRAMYEEYVREARKVTGDGDFVKSLFKKYLDGLPEDQCRKYGVQNCLTANKLSRDWDTEVWLQTLGANIAQEGLDRK